MWDVDYWKELVEYYADGRTVCGCGEAYSFPCGEGLVLDPVSGEVEHRNDLMICRNGCSANQLDAKRDIAERVCRDLGIELPSGGGHLRL